MEAAELTKGNMKKPSFLFLNSIKKGKELCFLVGYFQPLKRSQGKEIFNVV
jgi:hypothetical protein